MIGERNSVLIWGGGQHGRVVAEIARALGYFVVGYADADPEKLDTVDAAGARVLMLEAELLACLLGAARLSVNIDLIMPAVGDNRVRLHHALALGRWLPPPMIHPRAYVSPSAIVEPGTMVGPMAVVNTAARVGRGVIVNSGAVVGHDTFVADGAHIGAHVVLAGAVQVGECALVGSGADVIPGVRIGADVVVGAGAVVLRDVPDCSTVAGVPARPIESRNRETVESDLPVTAASVRLRA